MQIGVVSGHLKHMFNGSGSKRMASTSSAPKQSTIEARHSASKPVFVSTKAAFSFSRSDLIKSNSAI